MKIELEISRTYELDLDEEPFDNTLSFEEQINRAKKYALNLYAEEMVYFEDVPEDFVSVKIKNIS